MRAFSIVWAYLLHRPLQTFLNLLLLALACALFVVLLQFREQLNNKLRAHGQGVDLVVGAKGSPLQIILAGIYQIDSPTGNIKLTDAEHIAGHRLVAAALPMSLGDSHGGFRIVGTNPEYLQWFNLSLAEGRAWAQPMEVTVGAVAAQKLGLVLGSTFHSAHGLEDYGHHHDEHDYRVVGILEPTGTATDNLLLTHVGSYWATHAKPDAAPQDSLAEVQPKDSSRLVKGVLFAQDDPREITLVLLKKKSPLAIIQLPRYINSVSNLQAALPAYELNRLFNLIGVGTALFQGFAAVVMVIALLSLFIALYNALKERHYDIALMRGMGASRGFVLRLLLYEGGLTALLGSVAGIGLGHVLLWVLFSFFAGSDVVGMHPWQLIPQEGVILAVSAGLGLLAALIPAILAYRANISVKLQD